MDIVPPSESTIVSNTTAANTNPVNTQLEDLDPLWQTLNDQYEIQQHLGAGSFGQVLKAVHRLTGQVVAIKLMKKIF